MSSVNGTSPQLSLHNTSVSDEKVQRAFARRARKVLRRLRKEYTQVVRSCSATAIHDLRVATRRMQTLVDLAALAKPSKRAAKLRKRLKSLRHTLGSRRDLDVILGKLKERAANTASARRRRILRWVIQRMTPEARRVNRKMYRATRRTGIEKLRRLAKRTVGDRRRLKALSVEVLNTAMRQAEQKWLAAINTAKVRKDPAAYHDVRIKTKTLRYTIESVSRLVEVPGAEATTEWLKNIQDELGEWHDEIELTRRVTSLLAENAEFQANDAATALIKSLRDRAQAHTEYVSALIMSLRDSWVRRKAAASLSLDAGRQ
jgi:CHAD domain-containing protein